MRDGKAHNVLNASAILSPDGRHIASVVKRDTGKIVVRDGQESKLYSEVYALGFSPDSRHLAFWGKSNDKWFIVVDGVASNSYLAGPGSKPFTQFREAEDAEDLWQLPSNSSKSLQTIALRADEQIVRVRIEIVEE